MSATELAKAPLEALNETIVPIRPKGQEPDFILTVERPHPKIPPGIYEAVSTSITRKQYSAREYLEARFDVFEGHIQDGVVLAREVPGFFNLSKGSRPLGRSSKLARWIQLLGPEVRLDRYRWRTGIPRSTPSLRGSRDLP